MEKDRRLRWLRNTDMSMLWNSELGAIVSGIEKVLRLVVCYRKSCFVWFTLLEFRS